GITHPQVRAVVFANYLLRGFFNYLGAAVLEKFLIQAFHMRSDILLCSELVARIDLRAPSLKVVAVLNGIHTANILIFLAIWVRKIHPSFKYKNVKFFGAVRPQYQGFFNISRPAGTGDHTD